MNTQKLTDSLFEIEQDEKIVNLFDYKNTNAWVHVKCYIFTESIQLERAQKGKFGIVQLLGILWQNIVYLLTDRKKKHLFFGSSRGLTLRGSKMEDTYFPYKKIQPEDCKYFLNLNKVQEFNQSKDYYSQYRIISDNLLYTIYGKIVSKPLAFFNKKSFAPLMEALKAKGIPISEAQVRSFYIDYIVKYRFFKRVIKLQKNPATIFVVSAFSKSFICAVAKELNIHCVEIQHGSVGKRHIGYHYGTVTSKMPLPDELYLYNQFWKDEMQTCNFPCENTVYGNYRYEHVDESARELQAPYLLFTGQSMFQEEISAFLEAGISFLKEKQLKLVYKPHPSENHGSSLIKQTCEHHSDVLSYYVGLEKTESCIKHAAAHLSVFSACHFDAVHFIGKTYLVNFTAEENVLNYYAKKFPENFENINHLNQVKL